MLSGTPLIWALVFLAGVAFVEFVAFAIAGLRDRRRAVTRRRLAAISLRLHAAEAETEISILREEQGLLPGRVGQWLERVPGLVRLELLLYRAGRPMALRQFALLTALAAAGGALLGVVWPALGPVAPAVAGLALPWVWLLRRKRTRMRHFEEMLPDALDLLARALRAGHALSAALQMVGDECGDPIGTEFALVSDEMRFGLDLPLALANLEHRVQCEDLPFLVTALLIQRETGGNLAEIMDNLAHVIRDRHTTYGKVRAFTAQTRWSANILAMAPWVFLALMSFFRPDYVEPLTTTPGGRIMLGTVVVMVFVGYVLCRRVGVVRV